MLQGFNPGLFTSHSQVDQAFSLECQKFRFYVCLNKAVNLKLAATTLERS